MAKALNVIEQSIQSLAENTRNIKAQIAELSVDCLDHLHEHGQVAICNKLMLALDTNNLKMVKAFFSEFSGFAMRKDEGLTKKHQAERNKDGTIKSDRYADAKVAYTEFRAAGHNIWQWWSAVQKEEKPEAKPLDLAKVATTVARFAEKAKKENVRPVALLNAMLNGAGFTQDEVMDMLAELAAK